MRRELFGDAVAYLAELRGELVLHGEELLEGSLLLGERPARWLLHLRNQLVLGWLGDALVEQIKLLMGCLSPEPGSGSIPGGRLDLFGAVDDFGSAALVRHGGDGHGLMGGKRTIGGSNSPT